MKRTELRRVTPLRPGRARESRQALPARSAKTARDYTLRRKLVADLLDARPVCERCHRARSTDVHELLSRARGGSILDEENLACLCRGCHSWVTTEPALSEAEGWSRPSWWKLRDSDRGERSWSGPSAVNE